MIYYLLAAVVLSAGFMVTAIYSHAWVTDVPKVGATAVIRFFYMPHALAAVGLLSALGSRSLLTYSLAFLATLPISFRYAFILGATITWLKRRLAGSGVEGK